MKKQKSFTLIELLVVVSIIGLLASVVLVSTKKAKGKARIAGGLQFEASINHALGAYAVGIWDFDEGNGGITKDSSDCGNDGTINSNPIWRCGKEDTPSGHGCSLEFDGVNDYIEIQDTPSLNPAKGITITMWLYLRDDPECSAGNNWRTILDKIETGGGGSGGGYTMILEQNRRLVFTFYTQNGGSKYSTGVPGPNQDPADVLPIQEWSFVAFTYNASNSDARIYLNGRIPRTYWWFQGGGEIPYSSRPLTINYNSGNACPNGQGNFPGKIDNVRIYGESLIQAQIKKLYAEGLEKYKIAEK